MNNSIQILFFTPLILFLGIRSSYFDLRYKIIRNVDLLFVLIAATLIYLYLIIWQIVEIDLFLLFCNFTIALGITLILYLTDAWGSGDAKLFFVFCYLMLALPPSKAIPFSSLLIFINASLISMSALLVLTVERVIRDRGNFDLFSFVRDMAKKILRSFFILFGITWMIPPLLKPFNSYLSSLAMLVILYLSYVFIYKAIGLFKNSKLFLLVVVSGLLLRLIILPMDFDAGTILLYGRRVFGYSLVFYLLNTIFALNGKTSDDPGKLACAPYIFLGTILVNTDFIYYVMRLFDKLRGL